MGRVARQERPRAALPPPPEGFESPGKAGSTQEAGAARLKPSWRHLALRCRAAWSLVFVMGCSGGGSAPPPSAAAYLPALEPQVQAQFEHRHLAALLVRVLIDGQPVASHALGEARPGVPATQAGHFRNGAVAITYMSALMLRLQEEGLLDIDAPIARWLPGFADAERVTPRMLANMTAGYPDYVADAGFLQALVDDPLREWRPDELIALSLAQPRRFAPGSNWDYSHSDYVILGRVLERAGRRPLDQLLHSYILAPLALQDTRSSQSAAIPEPALHAYSAERGSYEDTRGWSPSWTLAEGAVQTTTLGDMARSFEALVAHEGAGGLLRPASRAALIAPDLVGFGAPLKGCPTCHTLQRQFAYGLGVFLQNDWLVQNPSFYGYASAVLTLPATRSPTGERITVAVFATMKEASYEDWTTSLPNWAEELAKQLAQTLVPANPPPPFRRGS